MKHNYDENFYTISKIKNLPVDEEVEDFLESVGGEKSELFRTKYNRRLQTTLVNC